MRQRCTILLVRGDDVSKFYNGCYDIVFKTVLCDENNPNMLKTFLEHLLKIEIDEIKFLQNELHVNDVGERKKTVDLLVKIKDKYIHIELNQSHKDYLHVRNFCFFSNLYSKNTRKGKEYDLASEFIHIDLSYDKNDTEEKRTYYVMDKDGYLYIKNLKIIEYNMDMITNFWYSKNKEKIEEYKYLIMLGLDRNSLNELSEGDEYMEEYTKKIEKLNDSDAFTSWITKEEDDEMILNTEKHISYDEGKNEGILLGEKKGILETAKKMLEEKIPLETIMRITNISKEEIMSLNLNL